ncbi:M20/M25/M40 family metallo-hydrolase [Mesorhizobium sp.]|uniref:M20/M25/M40 family metallo-hydrolase n=1 Tax=Mesorhizobium sp. TaxID=1871066 RepID=UPI000FE62C21|nr:M20/M25/M40 family metallo-hydrolase [Mesorhizobium sp.]RWJ05685.1 MAG: M20/M25/M40 family metallo-hydrolase [Mesorhizobium sp.]
MQDTTNWNPGARVRELSFRLVGWGSETGSVGEAEFGDKLAGLLRELPYFRENPDHVRLIDSHGDPMTKSVVALVRGVGNRALAMAGHYDVVSIKNYRELAHLAFDPKSLLEALTADLESRRLSAGEQRALDDFRTGEFLPGRGLLDMKCGVAAGVAVLEAFAAQRERQGNLLLIATPDEERGSRGMRSLRDALPAIAAEFGLSIEAGINLDATSDQGDGSEGRAIYRGTIGKALPFALVVGHSSHASYPFEGVSAQLIASEIIRAIEGNPELCDRAGGEVSPPPICLEAKDLRGGYEVTTPERVWVAFNWLSHQWSAKDLLVRFEQSVTDAASKAISCFNNRAQAYGAMLGTAQSARVPAAEIIPTAELADRVRAVAGAFERVREVELQAQNSDDPLALTRAVIDAMVSEAGITGPSIVYGLSSLVYPATHIANVAGGSRLSEAIETARLEHEASGGHPLKYREFFAGISDMSFFGHRPDNADSAYVAANTPASALTDHVQDDVLSFPVVNIGPWGREYHQRLERVYAAYAFEELPRLLLRIVARFLR